MANKGWSWLVLCDDGDGQIQPTMVDNDGKWDIANYDLIDGWNQAIVDYDHHSTSQQTKQPIKQPSNQPTNQVTATNEPGNQPTDHTSKNSQATPQAAGANMAAYHHNWLVVSSWFCIFNHAN